MLKTLGENEKCNWDGHISKLAFAYNAIVNKATGYSQYYLMFGRSPRLPIDFMFGIEPNEVSKDMQIQYKKFIDN